MKNYELIKIEAPRQNDDSLRKKISQNIEIMALINSNISTSN